MLILISILILLVSLAWLFNWRSHSYWKTRSIYSPPFLPFIGHIHRLFGARWEYINEIHKKVKSKGMWGIYETFNPVLYVCDPDIIRDITIKDWEHFVDRRPFPFCGDEGYVGEMLFAIEGQRWKSLRSLMTPTFTSGKIKAMFPLILDKADELILDSTKQMKNASFIDIHSSIGYYIIDSISTIAFGIESKCIEQKENSQFVKCSKSIFKVTALGNLNFAIMSVMPKVFEKLGLQVLSMDVEFLSEVVDKAVAARRKSKQSRGDALDILLDLYDSREEHKYPMTMETLKAQCFLFVATGFDTTGTSLSLALYLIAQNPEIQRKIRIELAKILDNEKELTYQNLMDAHYLDACISESLRLFPSAHYIERKCTKPYTLSESGLRIPENMIINMPLWSIHRDPAFWSDPLKYDPDRFLPENKHNIRSYAYMPFGLGPRNCIGMRFATLVMKICIAKICQNFELSVRPGFELELEGFFDSYRPSAKGVELVLKKIEE